MTRLAASLLRLESRYDRQDKDFRRLESVLSYGLERRVGERLTSIAGRVYSALLRVGCDSPRYGVCRLCHRVFRRARPSVKGSPFCSESCRKARLPHRRVTDLQGVSWVAVPGPRFAASDEDIKHRLVEAYCPDCYAEAEDEKDERVRLGSAFFWADTDRRVYCERHGTPAARAARKRRAQAVEAILQRLTRWAEQRRDVRALALVGSWARGTPRGDSDVDVVLLTDSPSSYIDHDDWLASVGGVRLLKTAEWGAITERRFAVQSGLEVELGVGAPAWASVNPLDDGTRRVVSDGMRALYDPEGVLATLAASCGAA